MSGWCGNPSMTDGVSSHSRCSGGNRANPGKEFSPCPCPCHYPVDEYECGNCGGVLREAPLWPQEDEEAFDEDGNLYPVYTHIDPATGRATGEECYA